MRFQVDKGESSRPVTKMDDLKLLSSRHIVFFKNGHGLHDFLALEILLGICGLVSCD